MPKRCFRVPYSHDGFLMRTNKVYADGSELVYCTERQTKIKCQASGKYEHGVITMNKPHSGHVSNDGIASAKLARMDLKNRAESTELAPRDLLHEAKSKHGVAAIVMSGSNASLQRMISRARDEKCPDTEAVDSPIPHFQGKMLLDNDQGKFLLFDEVVAQTGGRNVGFGSSLALEVLENSEILLTDGTFAVATPPFRQLWTIHAKFGDSTIPVVHVLMTFRGIDDYKHALEKIKTYIPNWNPTDYLGDLEIGQRKAVSDVFQGIRTSFCYFHLLQAWYRQLKKLKQDDLTRYGSSIYPFWSILRCLPYSDVNKVQQDFDDLISLIPAPMSQEMKNFVDYMRKCYVGPGVSVRYPPNTWNVTDRTLRHLPRTNNAVEAMHRNIERCVRDTRGRTTPQLSELLKCLRQEADKLKHDKEALLIDPTYKVSSQRKLKDIAKDKRILAVLQNNQNPAVVHLQGIDFLKAIRAAKKYI